MRKIKLIDTHTETRGKNGKLYRQITVLSPCKFILDYVATHCLRCFDDEFDFIYEHKVAERQNVTLQEAYE
jgi:hypothetical protein